MPKNLNALIRYKTLDTCLSNPHRKWRMRDLVEACSEALRESQGIDSGVSERTVRDDIRIMRSDILGFNAPIKQRFGYYWYSDSTYSIFGVSVNGRALLGRIREFINEIREEVNHPGMEEIVMSLEEALRPEPETESFDSSLRSFETPEEPASKICSDQTTMYMDKPKKPVADAKRIRLKIEEAFSFRWADVLNHISL